MGCFACGYRPVEEPIPSIDEALGLLLKIKIGRKESCSYVMGVVTHTCSTKEAKARGPRGPGQSGHMARLYVKNKQNNNNQKLIIKGSSRV